MTTTREKAPAGFRWLLPCEHRKAGDVYEPGSPIPSATIGWPINEDAILRPVKAQPPEIHQWCDPEHQDLVTMLNNMARAAAEGDEDAYDAFYARAMELVDELHKELSRKAGWAE